MRRNIGSGFLGAALVLAGLLFLLVNFGLFEAVSGLVIAMLFAAGGLAFLTAFLANHNRWWALIPAFALLGIGEIIALGILAPSLAGLVGGSLFLGTLALGFWMVYLVQPENWWAIIPGGVLFTLSVVAAASNSPLASMTGSILFFGLAATFGLVYLLPAPGGRMSWAIYPLGGCLAMGLIVSLAMTRMAAIIWPVALIAVGIFLVYRNRQQVDA